MSWENLANPLVLNQPVYEPGKPIEDVARELGLDPAGILKLASNENPFGSSPLALAAARRALEQARLYPDGGCVALRARIGRERGVASEQVVVGNGSNELLELIGHVFLRPGDEVVMGAPAFAVYKLAALLFGAVPVEVPLRDFRHDLEAMSRAVTPRTRLVFVASPNNPTGTCNSQEELMAFARSLPPSVVVAFDEAYAEFLEPQPDLRPLIAEGRPVICLRTFSKIYGLAALRVGYAFCDAGLAALLNRVRQPFNVNAIAQAAAIAALDDREFLERTARGNREGLRQLEQGLDRLGLPWVPSVANFILVKVGDGAGWFRELQKRGVIVRPLQPYALPEHVRITVGTAEDNVRLLREMASLKSSPPRA